MVTGKVLDVEVKSVDNVLHGSKGRELRNFRNGGKATTRKGHHAIWMLLDVLLFSNGLWNSMACVTQSFYEIGTVKDSIW